MPVGGDFSLRRAPKVRLLSALCLDELLEGEVAYIPLGVAGLTSPS